MSYKKLKELLESILDEDYLSLEEKLVEIGVLSYMHQRGVLNNAKEKKLIQYMEDATNDIVQVISNWLYSHGLVEEINEIGGNIENAREYTNEGRYGIESILDSISELDVDEDGVDILELNPIAKRLSSMMGGQDYFGQPAVTAEALKEFLDDNKFIDDGYEKEEEDEPDRYYIDITESEFEDFLRKCKREQVESSSEFMERAEDFVEAIKAVRHDLEIYDVSKAVTDFDHFKDLNHMTGNLLADYGGVDFDDINSQVEDRVSKFKK